MSLQYGGPAEPERPPRPHGGVATVLLTLIAVLLAAVAVQQYAKARTIDRLMAGQTVQQQFATGVEAASAGASNERADAEARSRLRNGAILMETYWAEHRNFAASLADLGALDPDLVLVGGASGDSAKREVAVEKTDQSYVLRTRSASGRQYEYRRDAKAAVTRSCGPGCTW